MSLVMQDIVEWVLGWIPCSVAEHNEIIEEAIIAVYGKDIPDKAKLRSAIGSSSRKVDDKCDGIFTVYETDLIIASDTFKLLDITVGDIIENNRAHREFLRVDEIKHLDSNEVLVSAFASLLTNKVAIRSWYKRMKYSPGETNPTTNVNWGAASLCYQHASAIYDYVRPNSIIPATRFTRVTPP